MAFAVIATWTAKPGEADYVKEVIREMTPGNRAEGKNLAFFAQVSEEDPNTIVLYERYTDATGYDEHKATEPFQARVLGDIIPRLASRSVKTFSTLD